MIDKDGEAERGCEPASRAEARRQKLLDTARALFIERGFHNTGIAQIARDSGVLVGQIYRDFASKEDIIAAIVRRDLEAFLHEGTLGEAIARSDTQAVREWIINFIDDQKPREDCQIIVDIMAESPRAERIAQIFQSVRADVQRSMSKALEVLAPAPEITARREALVDAIMAISLGVVQHRLANPTFDTAELKETLHRIIQRELDALIEASNAC